MLDAGLPGKVGYRLPTPFFRHHAFRADPGTDHHRQHEEDSVYAFHRRPQRTQVIKVARDESGSCPLQRVGGGRGSVAHQGADGAITVKQMLRGRADLLPSGADDRHWSLMTRHMSSPYRAPGA
jgi:hypothetical protein